MVKDLHEIGAMDDNHDASCGRKLRHLVEALETSATEALLSIT